MKLTFSKAMASLLVLGLVAGGSFFALRNPPRHGPRHGSGPSHRPESQSDSVIAQTTLPVESEIAASKLIATAKTAEPTNTAVPSNTAAPINAKPSLNWSRFRGPNGTGVSMDASIPTEWSDTQNLRWKTKLPGPGSSSPVLTETHVFLTSYKGYGEEGRVKGQLSQLKRQIHCIDRKDGRIAWSRTIDAIQPEDAYQGKGLPEHGFATNSMVTDGKSVFAFLGKSGVFAYDMAGNELWKVSVGTQSCNRGWGTAASLILYKEILIVNAAEESQTIFGINKNTGEIVWKAPGSILELASRTDLLQTKVCSMQLQPLAMARCS